MVTAQSVTYLTIMLRTDLRTIILYVTIVLMTGITMFTELTQTTSMLTGFFIQQLDIATVTQLSITTLTMFTTDTDIVTRAMTTVTTS